MNLLSKISDYMLNHKTPQTAKQLATYFMCTPSYARQQLETLVKTHELKKINTRPATYVNQRFK